MRHQYQIWVIVIVAVLMGAGIAAFLLSTAEPSRTAAASDAFEALTLDTVTKGLGNAAAYHREQALQERTLQAATIRATRWLRGMPGSRLQPKQLAGTFVDAGPTAAATASIIAFREWGDDLPANAWTSTVRPATFDGDRLTGTITVRAWVELRVRQARDRMRLQRIPVVLVLQPTGATAATGPTGWRLRSVTVGGGRTFTRAYADPIIVRRQTVDVIAPRALATAAARVADHAQLVLPGLRTRYGDLASTTPSAIWILEEGADAKRVLGRDAPSLGTTPTAAEALGWVDERGELALDWSRMAQVSVPRQLALVRHELTHIVLIDLVGSEPVVLLEGVATAEEVDHDAARGQLVLDLAVLDAAFDSGDVDLGRLLRADPTAEFAEDADADGVRDAYLAGYATIRWIELERGHDRLIALLTQLADDVPVERALVNVLRADIDQTTAAVRTWTRQRVADTIAGATG
ncbi:MAG: Peptidase superfamily [Thermoleophilia bacterium]|nr:Peptidase superfamily [Thermoleophilia bacterium]